MAEFVLFAGTVNPGLAAAIAAELGVQPGECAIERFHDGETAVRLDEPVRGRDVFLVQPTGPPVIDHPVELLACADACRRSAAGRVVAVVPYFGYARSDKRQGRREPITARLVARLMQAAGIDHVVTLDLHADRIEGFFRIPVDGLTAASSTCEEFGHEADDCVCDITPEPFYAVGLWYEDFSQTTDDEVREPLERSTAPASAPVATAVGRGEEPMR